MKESSLTSVTDEAQSGGIRAAVLGINEGLVTNVSLILGVAAGTSNVAIVKLAGLASLVAGACSMAVGEYVSMQAQVELLQRVLATVRRSFGDEGERLEGLRRAFACEGLSPQAAAAAAEDLGDDHTRSIELYSRAVLGINPGELGSPWVAALASLVTFAIGAALPLLPWYFAGVDRAPYVSLGFAFVAAFVIGAMLGHHTNRKWFAGGVRQVIVVAIASAITYGAGRLVGVRV